MLFEGKEQIFSKKCQCPPGGQSNFKFLYDDAQPDKCNFKKHPDSRSNYNILTLESKENNQNMGNNCQKSHIKTNYETGKEQYNIFHNQFPKEEKQSRIKTNYNSGNEQYNIFHNQFPQEGKQSSIKTNYQTGNEQCNIFHNKFPQEGPQSSIKTNYQTGNEKCNIFHNQFPQEGPQSSIKVTQMPGGNSHVRFAAQQ